MKTYVTVVEHNEFEDVRLELPEGIIPVVAYTSEWCSCPMLVFISEKDFPQCEVVSAENRTEKLRHTIEKGKAYYCEIPEPIDEEWVLNEEPHKLNMDMTRFYDAFEEVECNDYEWKRRLVECVRL